MRTSRRRILYVGAAVVAVAAAALWFLAPERVAVSTEQTRRLVLSVDGQNCPILLGVYSDPYVVRYRAATATIDPTRSSDVLDALWSTSNRDPKRYLSLLDEKGQVKIKEMDAEAGGKVLEPSARNQPFPLPEELRTVFTHWVELTSGDKVYRVMVGKQTVQGQEFPGLTITLVNNGGRWLQSFDLQDTPLLYLLGSTTHQELLERCRGPQGETGQ
jgi:hypothetical protein